MFTNNNHASFHMRWKENLLIYQEVSKYYGYGCSVFKVAIKSEKKLIEIFSNDHIYNKNLLIIINPVALIITLKLKNTTFYNNNSLKSAENDKIVLKEKVLLVPYYRILSFVYKYLQIIRNYI